MIIITQIKKGQIKSHNRKAKSFITQIQNKKGESKYPLSSFIVGLKP